jgi:hypothetical protein
VSLLLPRSTTGAVPKVLGPVAESWLELKVTLLLVAWASLAGRVVVIKRLEPASACLCCTLRRENLSHLPASPGLPMAVCACCWSVLVGGGLLQARLPSVIPAVGLGGRCYEGAWMEGPGGKAPGKYKCHWC